jgi:glycosyltransferase involved in cell wall biosynthesis
MLSTMKGEIMPPAADSPESARQIRVAVVCDYLEEKWPSMDLVGDMLCLNLAQSCDGEIAAEQIRVQLRRRISRLPAVPQAWAWNVDRLVNRFGDYASFLRRRRSDFDLFHIVDHSYSQLIHVLPANRTIVTCHDVDTFRCLLEPEMEKRPYWFRSMSQRILAGFRRAAHVIAVSAATRDDLLQHGLVRPEKISVISNGVHPSFTPLPSEAADRAAARLIAANDPGSPTLLSVGSTLQRKRLDVLLRVFAAVRRNIPGARLVRVGGLTQALRQLAKELEVDGALVNLPFLERDVLAAVYRRSDLLLQTSEAEGFGLPLIESMACGCPAVASDIPVLREVGGDAAAYCPVADVDAWAATVAQLLNEKAENAEAWELRRHRSLSHAVSFSWARNARQTARIYKEVLERVELRSR